ncbi:hypothetical protein HYV85_02470 [Candidatus Woesearchaeota archaeon]|nr:hypothetical protein [Candidatus Woesearchaeota archaeon]
MGKVMITTVFVIVLSAILLTTAAAHETINSTEIIKILGAKTPCSELTDDQLEGIGEYYMEQMHPGEAHGFMHQRMGLEEGSEAEEKFHINLAKIMYCGDTNQAMMGMMMGSAGSSMMGAGSGGAAAMMGSGGSGMMGYGMMGSSYGYWSLVNVLLALFLILSVVALSLLIVWLYKQIKRKK